MKVRLAAEPGIGRPPAADRAGRADGYELIKLLNQRSDGVLAMGQSTLYPMLYNLEAKGRVTSRSARADNGRPRKYYRLTHQAGKQGTTRRGHGPVVSPRRRDDPTGHREGDPVMTEHDAADRSKRITVASALAHIAARPAARPGQRPANVARRHIGEAALPDRSGA